MKSRFFLISLTIPLVVFMLVNMASCNARRSTPTSSQQGTSALTSNQVDLSQTMTITVTRRGAARAVNQEDIFAKALLERFNVILDVTDIAAADYVTRMNLMFAAGEADDLSLAHRPDFMLNDWIEAGYLRGFTLQQVQTLLPNYIAHYAPEAWPVVWENITYTDKLAYYLPGRRESNMNMAWLYREDVFNDLGLSFPDTTDKLFDVLVRLREATGNFPIVECDPGTALWAFSGLLQSFGMPELAVRDLSMVNPRTGEFEPFLFTTDNYRRFVSFLNRLYRNNLIWPEFATGTTEQRNSLQARGHRFIMWSYPEQIDTQHNEISRTGNPNAKWVWAKDMITENPANGYFFKKDPYFAADGIGFNADASNAVVQRFLYLLNWFYSDEGMVFRTYGIEGVHYQRQGNNYVFLPQMRSPATPVGLSLENFGFINFVPAHKNQNEYYRPYLVELENTFMNRPNYYFHTAPILRFNERESTELADVQTVLNQTRDQYFARFVMGQLDVNNDSVWDAYIRSMNQLGVQRVKDIRTAAFNRN